MITQFPSNLTRFTSLLCLLIAACGSGPVLISKSAAVPAGVDLSGSWQVRENSDTQRLKNAGVKGEQLIPLNKKRPSRPTRSRDGGSAQVFLEYGKLVKISQTDFGLFISYDRSVVEEYTYGENRLVEIGPIEGRRVSGWEGNAFVVETLDDSGTTLHESWYLDAADPVLIRDIRITKGDSESFVHRQFFDRR